MRGVALGVLVVMALIGLGWLGLTTRHPVVQPIGYWEIDPRSIGVAAITGITPECRLARTVESDAAVQIRVECDEHWLSLGSGGAGRIHEFTVQLGADLGARVVLDGDGHQATHCATPQCQGDAMP